VTRAVRLRIYGTECCHLCEQMRQDLEPWRQRHGFSLEWVEISGREELEARYGALIPVLEDAVSGQELCHYHLDEQALNRWLSSRSRHPA